MRIDQLSQDRIVLTLSERNLRTLLAKLHSLEPSACTIVFPGSEDGVEPELWVQAEEDRVHYAHREPGQMHPETEAQLRRQKLGENGLN